MNGNKAKDENMENKDIYFECVKYSYNLLLEDDSKTVEDCVEFTRKHFKPFITDKNYIKEISKLMTKLLFKKTDKEKSEINTESKIEEKNKREGNKEGLEFIKNLFIETFLKLNHKSRDDTLNTILLAGRYVLPQVL